MTDQTIMSEREALVRVCQGMIDIVERVGCKDWRDQHGRRLKDTKEWVEFYVTVNRAAEQAALTAPQPDGVVVPRDQLEYIANNLPDSYPASAIIARVRDLLAAAKEPRK